jgi:hypothetical protein
MTRMRTLTLSLATAALTFALATSLHSQAPAVAKSPLQQLQEMKTKNQALIEQQAAALQKLDAIQKEAEQVKFLAKRT